MSAVRRLRRLMAPLRGTPLHPQWLTTRDSVATRAAIGASASGRVLDIGCGDRWAAAALPDGTSYVGLDYPTTVAMGYPGRPEVFADASRLPFGDSVFDTLLLLDVLEHLPDPALALREAHRVLRPCGTLILQVPFLYPLHDEPHDFQRWTIYGLRRILIGQGFDVLSEQHSGQPAETAAVLAALACARSALDTLAKRQPSMPLAPFLLLAVPVVNIGGWLLGRVLPQSAMMPLSYRIVARCSA